MVVQYSVPLKEGKGLQAGVVALAEVVMWCRVATGVVVMVCLGSCGGLTAAAATL